MIPAPGTRFVARHQGHTADIKTGDHFRGGPDADPCRPGGEAGGRADRAEATRDARQQPPEPRSDPNPPPIGRANGPDGPTVKVISRRPKCYRPDPPGPAGPGRPCPTGSSPGTGDPPDSPRTDPPTAAVAETNGGPDPTGQPANPRPVRKRERLREFPGGASERTSSPHSRGRGSSGPHRHAESHAASLGAVSINW